MLWLKALGAIFSGPLTKALDLVDKRIELEGDKEKIKGDIIIAHMQTRIGWLKAGGIFTLLMFAVPVAFWSGSVFVYSVLWCRGCAWPQEWSIAAVPPPLDQWGWMIMLASIGGLAIIGKK